MAITKRDWTFLAVIVVLLGILLANSLKEKARPIPYNDSHRQFYQTIHSSGGREDVEKRCITCHGASATPLTPQHPPKHQCLLCHTLSKGPK